jgi:hypothetical protein
VLGAFDESLGACRNAGNSNTSVPDETFEENSNRLLSENTKGGALAWTFLS